MKYHDVFSKQTTLGYKINSEHDYTWQCKRTEQTRSTHLNTGNTYSNNCKNEEVTLKEFLYLSQTSLKTQT